MSCLFIPPSNLTTSPSSSFSVMDYSLFFKLALSCIDHLAWPLLALGYPLCASVQAIETDSYSETRDLISYWILFSLIYLFEYAFMRLLSWLQFWPYIKLMIIFWLIIPDFGRASYVYSNLVRNVRSFITLNPQAFIIRIKNWKKLFVKKENSLLHAERYIKENKTEALEKLTSSKTNVKMIQTEHKEIQDMEMIEKKEVYAGKQDIPIMPTPSVNQNISSPMKEANELAKKYAAGIELLQSSPYKEVQKEWTCALCQVTTTSEKTLFFHLNGNKHKDNCEALKAKNQPYPDKPKNDQSKVELKQKNTINQPANVEPKSIQSLQVKEQAQTSREPEKSMHNDPVKESNTKGQENKNTHDDQKGSKLRCKACHVTCNSEVDLSSHMKGKRHLDQISMLNSYTLRCEACNFACNSEVDLYSHLKEKRHLDRIPMSNIFKSRCEACNVTSNSKVDFSSHLKGKRHLDQISTLNSYKLRCEVCHVTCYNDVDLFSHMKGKRHLEQISLSCKLRCQTCNVICHTVVHLTSHLKGKRHLAKIQNLF